MSSTEVELQWMFSSLQYSLETKELVTRLTARQTVLWPRRRTAVTHRFRAVLRGKPLRARTALSRITVKDHQLSKTRGE
jgi:hypothetical protein